MTSLALGLFAALLLYLLVTEPLIAITVGMLAVAGAARINALERRIDALTGTISRPAPAGTQPASEAERASADPRAAAAMPPPAAPPVPMPMMPAAPGIPPPAPRAHAAPPRKSAWDRWAGASLGELEELLAGRLLAVIGGVALFLGAVFFLGLAFTRGWIGPEARVAIGLIVGVVLFVLGGRLLAGRRQIVAHVLVAVGLGVFSLALFAATRLYGFFAPEFGVAGALAAAAAAAALAVRFDSQPIAGFGLVAVLASPPAMGASATLLTLAFMGVALAGTTAIALFRSWRWLPPIAFVLAAPQLASYVLGDPPIGVALAAISAFWLLNALSAGGEEVLERRNGLSTTSATVLLATAAFTVAAGFAILTGELEPWRGVYLLAVAIAHLALAAIFLIRESDRHPFGMLAAGSGIAAVTMAVPVQLGAEWVPLAWAAEAVALAWIYAERNHWYSGLTAVVLGVLAAGHIVTFEYPLADIGGPITTGTPFLNSSGMALGFVVLAAAVAIWLLRARHERIAVGAAAAALVALAAPHELRGWAEVLVLSLLVAGVLVVQRRLLDVPMRMRADAPWQAFAERGLYASAALAGTVLLPAVLAQLPLDALPDVLGSARVPASEPFLNEATAIAAIVVAAALGAALLLDGRWRASGLLTAVAMVVYLLPFQVGAAWSVVGWAVVAAGLHVAGQWLHGAVWTGARVVGLIAVAELLLVVAPFDRLLVRSGASIGFPVLNPGVVAAITVAEMLTARAMLPPTDRERRWAGLAAGALGVYAASIAVVDLFQVQVGTGMSLEELQKQAQVALSVLWAVIGASVTVAGLRLSRGSLRLAGLGLLGLVTLKVFIVDLAALDIAYRVLSFVALGILLLGAAYLYGRMQPSRRTSP